MSLLYPLALCPASSLSYTLYGQVFLCFKSSSAISLTSRIVCVTQYWPDQSIISEAFDYMPCDLTATGIDSACCASTDPCSGDGFCPGASGYTYRGICTDINWNADVYCPSCRNGAKSFRAGSEQLLTE